MISAEILLNQIVKSVPKALTLDTPDLLRPASLTDIPEKARHEAKRITRYSLQYMLVRCVLRAAAIGMWHPDGWQFEDIREDFVRERACQVGKDVWYFSRSFFKRTGDKPDPRVVGGKARGFKKHTFM